MPKRVLALALVLLLIPATVQADGPLTHVVQPGENLFRIGLRYGVTAQQIASANRLANVAQIYAGQRLVIPAAGVAAAPAYTLPTATGPTTTTTTAAQTYHVVSSGETLYRIALRYGVNVQALATANHLSSASSVYVGQRLVIPGKTSSAPAPAAKSVYLRVPVLAQAHSLTCEAATARMAATYLGKSVTEEWLQAQLGRDENPHKGFRGDMDQPFGGIVNYGVYAEPLANALRALGLNADVRYHVTYDDLRAALDKGWPVIVWISQFPAPGFYDRPGYRLVPGEHTYVVVGYDATGFTVNDPLNGGRQFRVRAIPRWELFNNMALIVSKGQ